MDPGKLKLQFPYHRIRQEVVLKCLLPYMLTGTVLFIVLACAPSIERNHEHGLTIGISNEFPETPNYVKLKTLVLMHRITDFESGRFKDVLTQSTSEFLLSKGYAVIEVDGKTALKDGRVDRLLQIQPLNIYKQDDTLGYGFYDRKILKVVIEQPARSYVCMNVKLHRKDSLLIRQTGRQENFSKLPFAEMPDDPGQLMADQKKAMSANLEQNIRDTVNRVLPLLGL